MQLNLYMIQMTSALYALEILARPFYLAGMLSSHVLAIVGMCGVNVLWKLDRFFPILSLEKKVTEKGHNQFFTAKMAQMGIVCTSV